MNNIPILIPLGNGSQSDNLELRYALRSIEKNAIGAGVVYVITTSKPSWIAESEKLVVVPIQDIYGDCKDANLFNKVHETLKRYSIGEFVFMADDNAFANPTNIALIPPIHNHRPNSRFYEATATKWQRRVRRTLEWAKSVTGVELEHNFEAHCQALLDGRKILSNLNSFKYYPDNQEGKTIITTWRVITRSWENSEDQRKWKETYEMPCKKSDVLLEKPFVGYNDAAFLSGVREALQERFPEKSGYEK